MTTYTDSTNKYQKKKKKQKRKTLLLFLTLLFLVGLGFWITAEKGDIDQTQAEELLADTGLKIHFIDVGQGDATLLICDGHGMLIDAGNNDMGTRVQHYLKKQGIEKLDYLIGTHPDADHIGGLDVIMTKFDCGMVMMPRVQRENATYRDVIDTMTYRRYQNKVPAVGESYALGSGTFTIVAPGNAEEKDYNNHSIGILFTYGNRRFLFVGDAEEEAEREMLKSGLDLQADVLKVGHHGSSDSTSQEFFGAVNPTYAVISCGQDNDYGHPHQRVLNLLKKRDVSVYRTDEQGDVVLQSDGDVISFLTQPSVSWKSGWEQKDRR